MITPSFSRTAVFTLGLCLAAGSALAHAHLKSATPAVNSTVSVSPTELELAFSEGVNLKFSGVKLTGPDKKAFGTGEPKLGAGGDTVLVVPITAPLAAGSYRVEWRALANDGHKTTGSYSFSVKP